MNRYDHALGKTPKNYPVTRAPEAYGYRENPIGYLPTEDPSHPSYTPFLSRRLASLQGLATQMPYRAPTTEMAWDEEIRLALDRMNTQLLRNDP